MSQDKKVPEQEGGEFPIVVVSGEGDIPRDTINAILREQRLAVIESMELYLRRRQEELHNDIYGSRNFTDGVREENRRMIEWLHTLSHKMYQEMTEKNNESNNPQPQDPDKEEPNGDKPDRRRGRNS